MENALRILSAEFATSALRIDQCPPPDLPEVAFAGRSNVGKSSLINCLLLRKKLVRTSRTPGQTRMLNFFRINGAFFFVDLPGYGFAKVSQEIRARWGPMMEQYLTGRSSLRGVVVIMDARHPATPDDLALWKWLRDRNIPGAAVLTKIDKLSRNKRPSHVQQASLALGVPPDRLVLFSAVTQEGREAVLNLLESWIAPSQG
ncbi:MAG TPA: ribosome biogenesis GTP-binding protein YihA/YsxC [Syntrophobacteraceae bacterium]|nr:ribosome biogenesis GTP-binding protein YihA/YsxC [Syntrophobacteraceae bacterium]